MNDIFIQIFVIYISKEADLDQIVATIKKWMSPGPKIVIGDFNFDVSKTNVLSKYLNALGLTQIVNRPTHIEGGIIDHVYIMKNMKDIIEVNYMFPYYTDHISICLSITSQN